MSAPNRPTTSRPKRRDKTPELLYLPESTEFSGDPELGDPVKVLRLLKQFPQYLDPLIEATTPEYPGDGRRRIGGSWAMIYIAFLLWGERHFQRFAFEQASSPVWEVAGFDPEKLPCAKTVYNRLVELEQYEEAFVDAVAAIVQHAQKHHPEIGDFVWKDGTGYESHARLEHCCTDRAACKALGRLPKKLPRAPGETIKAAHWDADSTPEEALTPEDVDEEILEEVREPEHGEQRGAFRYYRYRGHLYRIRDLTAGARTYKNNRSWVGGMNLLAGELLSRTPVAIISISARESEKDGYERLYERMVRVTGRDPIAVAADKGFSYEEVFEFNTRRGVTSVMPTRRDSKGRGRERFACEEFDADGTPRCRFCGAPGDLDGSGLGFYFDDQGEPRLRYRCRFPATDECASQRQSITCSKEWRVLMPISSASETYSSLRNAMNNGEGLHDQLRDRYTLAGNDLGSRIKRFSSATAQQLRASAAIFIDWFRMALRNGWLGSHKRRNPHTQAITRATGTYNTKVRKGRLAGGIDLPYGPAAAKLGLAADASIPIPPIPRAKK